MIPRRRVLPALLALSLLSVPSARAQSPPERIISLAPNFTEIIYALGQQSRLVGVTPYCKFPPEARAKPKVGALVSANLERIFLLQPDLILMLPAHSEMKPRLERLRIPTRTIKTDTIAEIHAAIEAIGAVVGEREAARRLVQELTQGLADLARRNAARLAQGGAPPRVLFVIGRNPGTLQQVYACGKGSYLDELLTAAGARNALEKSSLPWPVVSKETILELDPDVILDGSIRAGEAPLPGDAHMRAWNQLPTLRAVRGGRVVAVQSEHLMIPGPWIVDGARMISDLIFPPGARNE